MNNTGLTALTSGTVALIASALTAVLTYLLTKRREQETDWRKLKLERYGEYVAALSAVIQGRKVRGKAQARYADAVNGMTLIAPPRVLAALYKFQDEISYRNTERPNPHHDALLNELMDVIRQDVAPGSYQSTERIAVRFMSVPLQ